MSTPSTPTSTHATTAPAPAPGTGFRPRSTLAPLSALLLCAVVLQTCAAVYEAIHLAPFTGERLSVRHLSAVVVRNVERLSRRSATTPSLDRESPRALHARANASDAPRSFAGQLDRRHPDLRVPLAHADLPPPANA